MTEEAITYLNEVLSHIQRYALKSEQIDWPALRQEITMLAADAQTPAETYPAIKVAIQRLKDRHSHFVEPANVQLANKGSAKGIGLRVLYPSGIIEMVSPGSPAEEAGVQIGEIIESLDGQTVSSLPTSSFYPALRKDQVAFTLVSADGKQSRQLTLQAALYPTYREPEGRRLAQGIGYVQLPELLLRRGEDAPYIEATHRILQQIDQIETLGWVIDLRHNPGGGFWGMLAALGPLLGEEERLLFVGPELRIAVRYSNGQATSSTGGVISQIEHPYQLKRPCPPVALLTGPMTGSSAEFVVLRFRGRPHTRSFGEATGGVPTFVETKQLSDGAQLNLTTGRGIDQTGRSYETSLLPDQDVSIDWARIGTDDDPVLQAALQWLQTE